MSVTAQSIYAAAAVLADQVIDTPCLYSRTLSEITGAEVYLKFENLQFTASFKERGALVKLLRTAVEQTSEDDGWAHMSKVANYISNNSSFSSINYGYKKFSDLIKASELFKVEMRKDGSAMYIKDARN